MKNLVKTALVSGSIFATAACDTNNPGVCEVHIDAQNPNHNEVIIHTPFFDPYIQANNLTETTDGVFEGVGYAYDGHEVELIVRTKNGELECLDIDATNYRHFKATDIKHDLTPLPSK